MNSCLYEGRVRHRRHQPVFHEFTYRLFMMYLDLDELDHVFDRQWLWSTSRPALAWFRHSDYLGDPQQNLGESVRDAVESAGLSRPRGPICLLTHLRYFGFVINPVSFYFCYDADRVLQNVVAHVTNTPWRERHAYVLEPRHFSAPRERHAKAFHVSPFLPMEMEYRWAMTAPAAHWNVQIESFDKGERDRRFDVSMHLQRKSLSRGHLARALAVYPWMTGQVLARIYWQALNLKRKGVPFYSHPRRGAAETSARTSALPG